MAQSAAMTKAVSDLAEGHEFPLGVLQMRCQPPHAAHIANVEGALARCDRLALLLGSSNIARSYKNPHTYEERKSMIEACFPDEVASGRLIIRPMPDYYRNNQGWAANAKRIVHEVADEITEKHGVAIDDSVIALAGFKKDSATGEYLDMFPEWADILLKERVSPIDATAIRAAYFSQDSVILAEHLPGSVLKFLERFRLNPAFDRLVAEREEIDYCHETYNKDGKINYTADVLLIHRNKVGLIKRGGRYGYGLWATPGGVQEEGEDILDCALRELDEETNLIALNPNLSIELLKASVKAVIYNDTKGRDLRGNYYTTLFAIQLPDECDEYKVEPRSDAKHVQFVEHDGIPETEFFADHHGMIHEAIRLAAAN